MDRLKSPLTQKIQRAVYNTAFSNSRERLEFYKYCVYLDNIIYRYIRNVVIIMTSYVISFRVMNLILTDFTMWYCCFISIGFVPEIKLCNAMFRYIYYVR